MFFFFFFFFFFVGFSSLHRGGRAVLSGLHSMYDFPLSALSLSEGAKLVFDRLGLFFSFPFGVDREDFLGILPTSILFVVYFILSRILSSFLHFPRTAPVPSSRT